MKNSFVFILVCGIVGFVFAEGEVASPKPWDNSFYSWAADHDIEWKKIEVKDIPHYGAGIVATEDIEVGDRILYVPENMIMHDDAAYYTMKKVLGPHALEELSKLNIMALFVLHQSGKEKTKWKGYFDTLPKYIPSTLYWSMAELDELQTSALKEATLSKIDSVRRNYDTHIKGLCVRHAKKIPRCNPEGYKWAVSIIWSRTFRVLVDDDSSNGLVPFADLFNAELPGRIKINHTMDKGGLQLIAKSPIKKGQHIFAPYSTAPLPNGHLLLEYGFLLENNPNQYYLIPKIPMSREDPNYNSRMALIDGLHIGKELVHLSPTENGLEELITQGRIIALEPSQISRDTFLRFQSGKNFDSRNDKLGEKHALRHLKRLFKEYPTTVEQDEVLLKEAIAREPRPERLIQAIKFRIGEKKVVQQAIHMLESKVTKSEL